MAIRSLESRFREIGGGGGGGRWARVFRRRAEGGGEKEGRKRRGGRSLRSRVRRREMSDLSGACSMARVLAC